MSRSSNDVVAALARPRAASNLSLNSDSGPGSDSPRMLLIVFIGQVWPKNWEIILLALLIVLTHIPTGVMPPTPLTTGAPGWRSFQ